MIGLYDGQKAFYLCVAIGLAFYCLKMATTKMSVPEFVIVAALMGIGLIVYLSLPFATLENRLSDLRGRGVVLKEGQTLRDLYLERTPLYEMYADVVIDTGALTLEQTREALENLAGRNCRKSQGNN